MKLKIYLFDYKNIPLDVLLDSKYLSSNDIKSFERYTNETVKKEKVASTLLKNKYIGTYHLDQYGKPICNDICFNVSHSHGVVVLVTDTVPVGIDIECIRPVEDKLKNFVSSLEERAYIKDDTSFYELWTNKEALTKAEGKGIKERPDLIPGLPLNASRRYHNKNYMSRTINYGDYVITVVREGEDDFLIEVVTENI